MARQTIPDRRLCDRRVRKGELAPSHYESDLEALPDLAEHGEYASDDSVEELAAELEAEKVARDARIERAIAEPARPDPPIRPPAVPIDLVD